jgi:energy-coupling factor transporter transmembrane protein EcfT
LWLAAKRSLEFLLIAGFVAGLAIAIGDRSAIGAGINGIGAIVVVSLFLRRIARAHFDWLSNCVAVFGLPLFSLLLVNSYISHKTGTLRWKGRVYGS